MWLRKEGLDISDLGPVSQRWILNTFYTEDFMSRKRKNKMNDQTVKPTEEVTLVDKKIIGVNPDGTPIYEETDVFAQTSQHTGEVTP